MEVKEAIQKRRAYRSLEPVKITKEFINDLAKCAQITASCFNNQPWQFVFIYKPKMLTNMHGALTSGNKWAHKASMIIAILGKKDDDCIIYDRIYYRFDIGMAIEAMILRATELGFVAHPIAGYSPKKTRAILDIPDDIDVITLVIIGKHSNEINPAMSEKQIKDERKRPERKPINDFIFHNKYRGR